MSSYLNYSSSLPNESKLVNEFMNFLPHIYTKMQAWIGLLYEILKFMHDWFNH